MITFVAYHVQVDPEGATATMYNRRDMWGGTDFVSLLYMLADSARMAVPNCRLVLCTDMVTQVPPDMPYERFRRQRGDYRVGAHRMETYAAFLSNQPPGKYVFVDTDVLIHKDPSPIFGDFDVGVCAPFDPGVKLNSGVVYVADNRAGIEWYTTCAEGVHQLEPEEQVWMGDQYVQQQMVFGIEPMPLKQNTVIDWHGRKVKILPCQTTNWSPKNDQGPADGDHAYVWHLKGPRKPRMPEFHKYLEELRCQSMEDHACPTVKKEMPLTVAS